MQDIESRCIIPPFQSQPWMADGLCAQGDPEIFFPENGDVKGIREAKLICQRCPVRQQCLAYAIERDEQYGVWGGLSAAERGLLRPAAGPDPTLGGASLSRGVQDQTGSTSRVLPDSAGPWVPVVRSGRSRLKAGAVRDKDVHGRESAR